MKFEFKAFTREGQLKEGIISAESKESALQILQEQGYLVTYLSKKKIDFGFFGLKPGLKDLYVFTKQLSYLLKARTPLDEAIKSLAEMVPHPHLRSISLEIYNDLISGVPFSQALSRFPKVFNMFYVGMIKVGETVGSLDEILDYLADHLREQIRIKSRIIQASIYPALVIIMFIGILIALFYFVIPQIAKIFIENNIPMPFITRMFKGIADFLVEFGWMLLIIFGFLVYYTYQYFKTKEGQATLFRLAADLPVFGQLIKNIYSAQFLESLYYLLRGGVPIVEALDIIKSSMGHPLYESALVSVIEDVKRGSSLSQSLKNFPEIFPSLIVEGMTTAEKTGQLTEVIFTIYSFYSETAENMVANLSEALQPVLIVVLGIGLGLLEASLLIPLLQLTKYVQTF